MKREVIVKVRNVYGEPKAYPVNEAARLFASIACTKTLTVETLAKAKLLGFEIIQETPAEDLAFMPVGPHDRSWCG